MSDLDFKCLLRSLALTLLFSFCLPAKADNVCARKGVSLQVLGSGGSDLANGRAGAAYLLWIDHRARVLVNAGAGSAANFVRNSADFADLDLVLLNNLHADTWADLPVMLRTSYYGQRKNSLPIIAPAGNNLLTGPRQLFDFWEQVSVAEIYPAELLASAARPILPLIPFHIEPVQVPAIEKIWSSFRNSRLSVQSLPVDFGNIPAVAWLVDTGDIRILFAGNLSAASFGQLPRLTDSVHTLVAHLSIDQGQRGLLSRVHTKPSAIARMATRLKAGSLLLGHRMGRTLGTEEQVLGHIRKEYEGSVLFAEDSRCLYLQPDD